MSDASTPEPRPTQPEREPAPDSGSDRVEYRPEDLPSAAFSQLIKSIVLPRPIAWVSTRSTAGVNNLAAFSFFTVASTRPPILMFTCSTENDTLRNVRETGELVVNLSPEGLYERINITGTEFPAEVDEFEEAGVTPEATGHGAVPRVAESPVAMECTVHTITDIGSGHQVFARVQRICISPEVLRRTDSGRPDVRLMRPLARLGGDEWMRLGEIFPVPRWTMEQAREIRLRLDTDPEGDQNPSAGQPG